MAAEANLTTHIRARLFNEALAKANQKLENYHLVVKLVSQLVNSDLFVQSPDFDLAMHYKGRWLPIDVIYLGPKKETTVDALSQDIYEKAIDHLKAMSDTTVLITSLGTKYNTAHLKEYDLWIDSQGYLRVDGMRVVSKEEQMYRPIKATQFRSHTRIRPEELAGNVLNITERNDASPTSRKKGIFCVTNKARFIALEKIVPYRRTEAEKYEDVCDVGGHYIPLVLRWSEVENFFDGSSNFFD